jgi:hypothetical protein
MLLIFTDIFINVRIRKRALIQPIQLPQGINRANQQRNLQLQMFILMLASTGIFLITTFPISIFKIITPRQVSATTITSFFDLMNIWAGLQWFQTLNFAVNNFLLHDLYFFFFFR